MKGLLSSLKHLAPASPPRALAGDPSSDLRAVLRAWKAHTKKYQHLKLLGAQKLIEPYIVQKCVAGFSIDFLIATVEAKSWWDVPSCPYDIELLRQLRMIKPGDVVFDLGANHGFYALIFANLVGPEGRVYAFDPFPVNADITRFNSRLNRLDIEVFEVGLSNEQKTVQASLSSQNIKAGESADSLPIRLDKLDHYAHLKPDFIKIDIEGAEIDALQGAQRLLAHRPNLYIEVHTSFFKAFGRRLEELFDYLPLEDYLCFISHPGYEWARPYTSDVEIKEHCTLFLTREEPVRRVYL
jgi:FkbM family methyltransferase